MAAVAQSAAPAPARPDSRWIISRGVDGVFVIGSALGWVRVPAALRRRPHPHWSLCGGFWSIGFDGTHIFATASRTYFDREARVRNRRLFFGSLLFFFSLGPVLVLAGWKGWLYLLVGAWAYYHVIRQHYGFMVLYKVKNRDLGKLDNVARPPVSGCDAADAAVPPVSSIHHPEELGIPCSFPRLEMPVFGLIALVGAIYLGRQWRRIRGGDAIDLPKYLLLAAVIPLHWLTFAYMSWQAAVPTVTIVHNLQYHAIVWFHNRNRYREDAARHGRIPAAVSRSLLAYAAIGLVFSLLYRVPGFELGKVSDLAFGFFCGFGLTHYYLDSRIWRVRHDPGLRAALQMG